MSDTQEWADRRATIFGMRERGGNFFSRLAAVLPYADEENYAKIANAFPVVFAKYLHIGREMIAADEAKEITPG